MRNMNYLFYYNIKDLFCIENIYATITKKEVRS